ncbi:hypothetical protein FH972_021343 [Carpinus fangiana]|uniref:HTH La-type RNA-binding domain-containing protein n=1 Tax=Carpinus fangiana TaxID=176857 RepID=A0A5N6KPM9_9ROSI|nr:hypothetical protein FH972_021343 [Carpinus fangiana]
MATEAEKKPLAEKQKDHALAEANGAPTEPKPAETGTTADGPDAGKEKSKTAKEKDELQTRKWRDKADEDNHRDGHRRDRGGFKRGGGGRGGFQRRDYSGNVKTNYEDLPESNDADDIRKQVEFYFADSNIVQDKFLLTQIGGAENKPISIKVIHNFKRMRRFQPYSAVVAALKDSKVLKVTDDDEVARVEPLPEGTTDDVDVNVKVWTDASKTRSIYAKGFGLENSTTQMDIEAFFEPYGPVSSVRLRRTHPEKHFKGSVFVEFGTDELAQDFLNLEPKPKYENNELKIMSKTAYVDGKAEDIKAGKIRPSEDYYRRDGGGGRGRGGNRNYGGGDRYRDRRHRDLDEHDERDDSRRRSGRRDADKRDKYADEQAPGSAKKRTAEDDGEQGDTKKSKTEDE